MKLTIICILAFAFFFEIKAQERQPFYFHVARLFEAFDMLGVPLKQRDKLTIEQYIQSNEDPLKIQEILDRYALFQVQINPESRVKANGGAAQAELHQDGWKIFLIKIENQAGITAGFKVESEQAKRVYEGGFGVVGVNFTGQVPKMTKQDITDRWLDMSLFTKPPMKPSLSGLEVEYFIVQLYSRDAGKRAAKFSFNCGQSTQDIGLRNEVSLLFNCTPSQKIKLEIREEDQKPATASLIIKDRQGHVYPSKMKRLAPDFFFQPQIYRSNGEYISLPEGEYDITGGRGPEYYTTSNRLSVSARPNQNFVITLKRWINPVKLGWYSGDHHIHAAGCSHYTSPSEGVAPDDMMRHILGEGLNVGSVLTWGPGYYHQKQFFEGKDNKLSTQENLMRYDLEISGFPSSHAGHLVLLRLKDQDYPNTKVLEDWPSYTIPVLKWAKAQNAITGYAHSGFGLEVREDALPNYEMPKFDGIGANEYIVAVTQNLVDFISTMDTPPTWELNIWYHTLNCGFRTRISGETDFPCISDEQVGHGRSYVRCENGLNFNDWAEGLRLGKAYVSEGKSHIINFKVNNIGVGTQNSEVNLSRPSRIKVSATVAAFLTEQADSTVSPLNLSHNVWDQKPWWNIERGRIANTRKVPVELIINGIPVDRKEMVADGSLTEISFETNISNSSWVALRILPSSHSNPIFVLVGNTPIRANKRSAEWCLKAVEVCWEQKQGLIAEKDKESARKEYEKAKEIYRQIIKESNR